MSGGRSSLAAPRRGIVAALALSSALVLHLAALQALNGSRNAARDVGEAPRVSVRLVPWVAPDAVGGDSVQPSGPPRAGSAMRPDAGARGSGGSLAPMARAVTLPKPSIGRAPPATSVPTPAPADGAAAGPTGATSVAAAAGLARPASAPEPSLLDTEATRRALRDAARTPSLGERLAKAREEPKRPSAADQMATGMQRAGKGDCAKGDYPGAGMGLLSLPFFAAAVVNGNCAK